MESIGSIFSIINVTIDKIHLHKSSFTIWLVKGKFKL